MNVYVIGAGVSKTAGYPLGAELFEEVDAYVRNLQSVSNTPITRPEYVKDWPQLCDKFAQHPNPLIKEAYRTKHLEFLFTILDSAGAMQFDAIDKLAIKQGRGRRARFIHIMRADQPFFSAIREEYTNARAVLLWALGTYFQSRHHEDGVAFDQSSWPELRHFARKLQRGDVIITFNYDSTLERVLFRAGLWTPDDGYGFKVRLQKSWADATPVFYDPSPVTILHLHGALGWRSKMSVNQFYRSEARGRTAAPWPEMIKDPISLDHVFLTELGIEGRDSDVPEGPNEFHALHPSYLKAFGFPAVRTVFLKLWRRAAELIRAADKIFIIGYSLPEADTAALTLFVTICNPQKIEIVNSNAADAKRLRFLLAAEPPNPAARSFGDCLNETPDRF